jgi:hypothetical protein
VGLRAGLVAVDKRNIFCLCPESNEYSSAVKFLARRYTDWAIPDLHSSPYTAVKFEKICVTMS